MVKLRSRKIVIFYYFLCLFTFAIFGQNSDYDQLFRGEFFNQNYRIKVMVYPDFYTEGGLFGSIWELEKYTIGLTDSDPEIIRLKCVERRGTSYKAISQDNNNKYNDKYELHFSGEVTDKGILLGDVELKGPNLMERLSSAPELKENISEAEIGQTNNPIIPLVLGGLFLILFVVLTWYLKKVHRKLYTLKTRSNFISSQFYPKVRISRRSFLWRHRVVILYKNSIVVLKKWKWKSIADLHEADSKNLFVKSEKGNSKYVCYKKKTGKSGHVFKARDIGFEDIRQVTLYPRRAVRTHLIKIRTRFGKYKVILPDYECNNFIIALREVMPSKVRYGSVNLFGRILTAIVVTAGVLLLLYSSLTPIPLLTQSLVWISLLFLICFLPIIFIRYDLYNLSKSSRERKRTKDLSYRKPIRSNILAYSLRFLAVASIGLYIYNQFIPWNYEAILFGGILWLSIALAKKRTDKLRENDNRKPILYLRSFLDDNESTLNPCTTMSTVLGVDPPYHWLSAYGIEEGLRYRIGKFIIKYAYGFWPSRLIRLLFGNPLDTSEEQLTNYFKRYGLVVAIGKPGEKITTLGASRMYVTNDEWKQTVIDLLNESQFVLLQPSSTGGVWWEIERVFKLCDPENIILCMVNYRMHQEYYENFYRRLKSIRPDIKIPRSIGNDKMVSFITFGLDWKPQIHELKYYSKLRWFFTGNALNLKRTFDSYIQKRSLLLKSKNG